jgi:hypothetical protein
MAKGLRERVGKQYKGTQRTRKAVHGECTVELAKWTFPIISLCREPYEAKVSRTGLTGGMGRRTVRQRALCLPSEGNNLYRAFGQRTHSHSTGIATVRGRCICQHQDGDGTRMDGRANPGERLINIVTKNKPKVLEGLSQKGTVAGTRTLCFLVMGIHATGGQSAPHPFVCDGDGTWQPRTSPVRESEPQDKPIGVRAWEDGRSEGHSVMEWIGVEPIATSPHAKAR